MTILERHAGIVVRYRWRVVLVVLALSTVLGAFARDVHVEMDPDRTLPAHHPFIVADKTIAKDFGGRRTVVVAMVPEVGTIWSVPVLQKLAALTLELYRAEGVRATNVLSLASPNARDIRSSPEEGLSVEYLIPEPPQSEADGAAIRAAYERNPSYHGLLVSEDSQAAMITASVVGMAVGIGADYAIYLLYRTREEYLRLGDVEGAIGEALRTSGTAVTFVALAVSVGYAALLLSPFAVYWMLGLTVPLTMVVSCGVTITLLPYVLARWRPRFVFPQRALEAPCTVAAAQR